MNARARIALAFFVGVYRRNAAAFGLSRFSGNKHPAPGQKRRNECLALTEYNPSLTASRSVQRNLWAHMTDGRIKTKDPVFKRVFMGLCFCRCGVKGDCALQSVGVFVYVVKGVYWNPLLVFALVK